MQGPSQYGTLKSITSSVHRSRRGDYIGGFKSSEKSRLGDSIDIKVESSNQDEAEADPEMRDYEDRLVEKMQKALEMQIPEEEATY